MARRYRIATGLACGRSSSSIPRAAHALSCITSALRGCTTASASPPFRCFFRDFPSSSSLPECAAVRLDASRASSACDSACSATGLKHPPAGTANRGSRRKLPAAASMASSDAPLRTRHRLAPPPAPPPGTSVKDCAADGDDSGAPGQRSAMRSNPRRSTSFKSMLIERGVSPDHPHASAATYRRARVWRRRGLHFSSQPRHSGRYFLSCTATNQ